MRTRPILFSGPMVKALLAGTKTQTRRIVKPQPNNPETFGVSPVWGSGVPRTDPQHFCLHAAFNVDGKRVDRWLRCPYGKSGDRLWVRESFCGPILNRNDGRSIFYAATDERQTLPGGKPVKWKPSIFMRPTESRITLEITSVRVERLHAISEDDARAEGVGAYTMETWSGYDPVTASYPEFFAPPDPSTGIENVRHHVRTTSARERYAILWNQINGKKNPCSSG